MGRTLDEWLAHCERLHPKTIELTLDRVSVPFAAFVQKRGCRRSQAVHRQLRLVISQTA